MDREDLNAKFKSLGLRTMHTADYSRYEGAVGFLLIITSSLLGLAYFYAAVLSKLLPHTGNFYLDAIKEDNYYCYLVPLAILPTYLIFYVNWLCMSLYESN